ncbi:MAG: hypothetical protein K0R90_1209, partial [Oscillospiraceae bacterium]|nr:hypothetical protein [Oscillospiraceae bacterium]
DSNLDKNVLEKYTSQGINVTNK